MGDHDVALVDHKGASAAAELNCFNPIKNLIETRREHPDPHNLTIRFLNGHGNDQLGVFLARHKQGFISNWCAVNRILEPVTISGYLKGLIVAARLVNTVDVRRADQGHIGIVFSHLAEQRFLPKRVHRCYVWIRDECFERT